MAVATLDIAANPTRYRRAYYEGFLISLLIVWLPFKFLAYITPFIFVTWFILRSNSGKTLKNLLLLVFGFVMLILFYSIFYFLIGRKFVLQNALLFFLTYNSFLILLVLPSRIAEGDLDKYIKVLKYVILFQSLFGIFQGAASVLLHGLQLDLAAGDVIQGTLNPLSFLTPGGNFNNQIYTSNLLLLLLFYSPYAIYKKKGLWICLIGFFAILIASVWHLFGAFIIATLLILIYFTRSFLKISVTRILLIFSVLIFLSVTIIIQPKNFSLIFHYYEKFTSLESPKAIATVNSVTRLPREFPWVYVIGLGPGQYASRAGLIGTGKYFGDYSNPKKIPVLKPDASDALDKYIIPKWEEVALNPATYGNSTMSRPFYSMLSLLIELGFVAFGVTWILLFVLLKRVKNVYRMAMLEHNKLDIFYALACGIAIAYIAVIAFFENYLEIAHAIFVGLLLLKYFYSQIRYSI